MNERPILTDMYQIFKTESYYNLIKSLVLLDKFYTGLIDWSDEFNGHYKIRLFYGLNLKLLKSFVNTFEDLKLTTPDKDTIELNKLYSELRTKFLYAISIIPNSSLAIEKYLVQFGEFYMSFHQQIDRVDSKEKSVTIRVFEDDKDGIPDIISKEFTVTEVFEYYKKGGWIEKITDDEFVFDQICSYFKTKRDYIFQNKLYKTINVNQFGKSINLEKIFDELCNLKFVKFYYKQAFICLFSGETYFEPIIWEGGLAELNKFIKALYSVNSKLDNKSKIEWKAISSIFIIDKDFTDPDKLKGASASKMGSTQELKPFLSIIKSAILKNLDTN